MLGPSSDVNLTSDTTVYCLQICRTRTYVHATRSQFVNPPGSGVYLTPEPDSTPINALFYKQTHCNARESPASEGLQLACKSFSEP